MFESFCRDKLGPLVLRLALGVASVYHGYLKIMAAGGTSWYPGLPVAWQLLLAWGEFASGLAILVGFYCRWSAGLLLALTFSTLVVSQGWNLLHLPVRALEPVLLLLMLGLAVLFLGAGELSLDRRSGSGSLGGRAARRG